jgi:hypothetical protein
MGIKKMKENGLNLEAYENMTASEKSNAPMHRGTIVFIIMEKGSKI